MFLLLALEQEVLLLVSRELLRRSTTQIVSSLGSIPYVASIIYVNLAHTYTNIQKGSVLAFPDNLNTEDDGMPYVVEGIGYDFIPSVLARGPGDVDVWIKTSDEEAFGAVRSLMRSEGLLVGGSSGSSLYGALKWLKSEEGREVAEKEGMNVVVLLPDG